MTSISNACRSPLSALSLERPNDEVVVDLDVRIVLHAEDAVVELQEMIAGQRQRVLVGVVGGAEGEVLARRVGHLDVAKLLPLLRFLRKGLLLRICLCMR